MATQNSPVTPLLTLQVQSQPNEKFYILELNGYEEISSPYWFKVLFASENPDLTAQDYLQQAAMIKIFSSSGEQSMQYSGVISSFSLIKRVNNFVLYEIELRPKLWKLSLNRITDVYCEEKSIPEIVAQKLQASGLTQLNFEQRLKDASVYRKRSFVCQFYETDLDFLSRYMEGEGIYYYFDQSEDYNDKIVMVDYKQGQPATKKELYYFDAEDMPTDMQDNRVTNLSLHKHVIPKKTVVQDFNYRKANLENSFKADEPVDSKGEGTYMYWGYNLRDLDEAQRLAKVRSEEFLCQQAVINASSTAIDVRSGYSIDLKQHFQKAINKSYLVTSVKHHARQSYAWFEPGKSAADAAQQGTFYTCEFEAVDDALQYRPARKTKWPFVSGTLSGIIDDEGSGKYAQLNDYGQYKVQLLFDLSEQNTNRGSSWIRMITPYAGQGHGMAFPLLKGTEVIIGFMGGDPDQPIILGAVPNSENRSVLNAAKSTLGGFMTESGNQLITNDRLGQEGMQIWSPGGDSHILIGNF